MLQVANEKAFWSGTAAELSISFDTLRDFQWKRVLDVLWSYPGLVGPLQARYTPHSPLSPEAERRIPNPTDMFSQFGVMAFSSSVQVGVEILATRSLFECVSLRIPLNMFDNVSTDPHDPELKVIESTYYNIALQVYQVVPFEIAAIGLDRECQLLMELRSDLTSRRMFLETGNFFARDHALTALDANPRNYREVMPSLRWCPSQY